MLIVPDFVEIPIKAKDVVSEADFKVAFKLVSKATAKLLKSKLLKTEYRTHVAILQSNIVYVAELADVKGNLTNSFETAIIKELLQSPPYYQTLLGNYYSILVNLEAIQVQTLQEQNLFNLGKWQYEIDYGVQDLDTKIKQDTKNLQESLGEFMNFEDEPKAEVEPGSSVEVLITAELPNLQWKSNVPYLEIFNIAKLYANEWNMLNPVVLIELAKEFELKLKDVLTFIAIIKAGYESMKPKTT